MISIKGLSVGYGSVRVLSNLNLEIPPDQTLLVIGHNGAGKSTLLKTLFRLIPPQGGRASVFGSDLAAHSPRSLLKLGIRFLGQGPRSFDDLRVAESRMLLQRLHGFTPSRLPEPDIPSQMRIGSLSIGQRRLEALYLLSAGDPRLYLLDEPSAGLDFQHCMELIHWIKNAQERGIAFIIVEHRFRMFLEVARQVAVFKKGTMSFVGPPKDLLAEGTLEASFL